MNEQLKFYLLILTIIPGLFFARFKKTQNRKKLAQKKTQGKFLQKTQGTGVT